MFFAVDVEAVVGHRDSTLRRGGPSGEVIATGTGRPQRLSLEFLGERRYANGQPVSRQDTITVADDYSGWAQRRKDQFVHGEVVYGRVARGSDGRTYLQYWMYYVFNDSLPLLGDSVLGAAGDHEGDWELVPSPVSFARLPAGIGVM